MFCSKCGKEISNNSEFCKYCGNATNNENLKKNNNVKNNPTSTTLSIIFAIISIIVAVLGIYGLLNSSQKEADNIIKQVNSLQNSIYFNCPYCNTYVRVNKSTLYEMTEYYTYICQNCMKVLRIDKNSNEVTLLNQENY